MAEQRYGIGVDLESNVTESLEAAADAASATRGKLGRMATSVSALIGDTDDSVTEAAKSVEQFGDVGAEAFETAGAAAEQAAGDIAAVGTVGESAFQQLTFAVMSFDSVLSIGRQTVALWRATVGDAIDTALRFRKVGDEAAETFSRLDREAELLKARIGDALIPVVLGMREAFLESEVATHELIGANQKMISMGMIEWIRKVGTGLARGIAVPVQLVAKAWLGWQLIVHQVKATIAEAMYDMRREIAELLKSVESVARFAGFDEIADKIVAMRNQAEFGDTFKQAAADAQLALQQTVEEIEITERTIERLRDTAIDVFERGMAKAQKRVEESVTGTNQTLDEQREVLDKIREADEKLAAQRKRNLEEQAAAAAKLHATRGAEMSAQAQAQVNVRQQVIDAAAGAFGDIGTVVTSFMQGPVQGAIATVNAMIARSEALQAMIQDVVDVFDDLVRAFEPLFAAVRPVIEAVNLILADLVQSIAPLLSALAEVLRPLAVALRTIISIMVVINPQLKLFESKMKLIAEVMEFVGSIIESVALGILGIFNALRDTWNGIVAALSGLLRKIGEIKIPGLGRPFVKLLEWAKDVDKLQVSAADVDRIRRDIQGANEAVAEASGELGDSARDIAEATADVAGSMTNVPAGLKVALRRFQSTDPFDEAMSPAAEAQAAAATDAGLFGDTFGMGGKAPKQQNITVQQMIVSGVNDVQDIIAEMNKQAERQGTVHDGPLVVNQIPGTNAAFRSEGGTTSVGYA